MVGFCRAGEISFKVNDGFGLVMTMVFFLGAAASGGLPSAFVLVYVVGFIAAVTIGSIAWYNSKRPAGWENKDKPNFIPEVKGAEDQPGED
jgi:hypothetical protein